MLIGKTVSLWTDYTVLKVVRISQNMFQIFQLIPGNGWVYQGFHFASLGLRQVLAQPAIRRSISRGGGVIRISGIRRLGNFGRPIPLPSTTTTTGILGFFSGGGAIFKLNATRHCNMEKN